MTVHMSGRLNSPGLAEHLSGSIDPNELKDPSLRRGLVLWQELRGPRRFPARAQISPRVLGTLLRNTILIKVLDGGAEFQVRIMGDAILAVQNDPIQGLTTAEIDKLLPGYGTQIRGLYTKVCADKAPLALRGSFTRAADQRVFHREHLLVPLGDTDDAVDYLISFVIYSQPAI